MRPLARWTFGKSNKLGEECLRCSIRRFSVLYPEFDFVICCNNINNEQLSRLIQLGFLLHQQKPEELDYPLESASRPYGDKHGMPGWGWKLVPPRLRFDAHELWIDNDILLRERLPTIDAWLKTTRTIISTGLRRAYGIFDSQILEVEPYCAGLFGLPPGFNFASRIASHCQKLQGKPLGYYDEQGLTASVIEEGKPMIIPLEELAIMKTVTKPYPKGMHFIGLNRTDDHQVWKDYKCCLLM